MLMTGLTLFAAASLGAGLAPSTGALLAARAVQGIGAALAIPAAMALLSARYRQERERERALGLLSATLDVGMVTGLVLGGALTASLGWPWCFFIVVPLGLAAAAFAPFALEESSDDEAPRLDVPGAVLAAAGCGLLVFGFGGIDGRSGTGARGPRADRRLPGLGAAGPRPDAEARDLPGTGR
jgi:MFS family permease